MADKPHRAFRIGSVIWALVLGTLVLVLGASIMLPSTERARIDFNELQERREAAERETAAAATQASSQPTTEPAPAESE